MTTHAVVPCYGEGCGLLVLLEEQPRSECCGGRQWFAEHCGIEMRMSVHDEGCPAKDGPVHLPEPN